ncbi:transcriptional regulator [Sphingomonas oleivorans]|uniref:Transcriptional regulator n=1 Tax=Sphingomonas oleivorans TaxID=1735121 RepID=A0A2T5G1Z9_9SPHN|nr:metalloregulator ArsR/SmtB family transcription factor [Sphingomonas oleivorans]PTQ13179.1 transcriptional regulator [Sphingomonas oleivorans]
MARPFHHPAVDEITLDGILYALSDPTRRSIVGKLLADGEMNCGQACKALPPSTVSHHHRILRENGLIRSERRGVEVINSARREEVERRFPGLLDAILNQTAT